MASTFNKPTHVRYFLRCLKTYLPTAYTSNDSQRMTLAFFILCGLDLLGALETNTTEDERTAYVEWIYRCQHPDGGFRGFTGADVGEQRSEDNAHWDPANIAATYFALASLAILGDDLSRVERNQTLGWLKRLQLSDGTFGEALGSDGEAHDGRDMRFCYCAVVIRWLLVGETREEKEDIDIDGMVRFIEASQGHCSSSIAAGWTYCAIAALSLLARLPSQVQTSRPAQVWPSEDSALRMLGWLVNLQTCLLQEEDVTLSDTTEAMAQLDIDNVAQQTRVEAAQLMPAGDPITNVVAAGTLPEELSWAGLTGRCNKVADTCYSFWAGGSLMVGIRYRVAQTPPAEYLLDLG
ncbi:MAG: hypothetical protein Q9169_001843 [Polycauliona sp. 2 TL-2023]